MSVGRGHRLSRLQRWTEGGFGGRPGRQPASAGMKAVFESAIGILFYFGLCLSNDSGHGNGTFHSKLRTSVNWDPTKQNLPTMGISLHFRKPQPKKVGGQGIYLNALTSRFYPGTVAMWVSYKSILFYNIDPLMRLDTTNIGRET